MENRLSNNNVKAHRSADTEENIEIVEIPLDDLAQVAGGNLTFTFKLVAVKTISW
jgi:hypothetical protein